VNWCAIVVLPKKALAAGYMKIINAGTAPDRLISGSSDVAPAFEVHEMSMDNNVAKMRPIKGGLEIKQESPGRAGASKETR
jgi:hypothetical protein